MTMTDRELETLHRHIDAAERYLEFGSGQSTVYAASAANLLRVDSVESSEAYVRENLVGDPSIDAALASGKLTFHLIDLGETVGWGFPRDVSKRDRWPEYSSAVFSRARDHDLVLVDGRFRVACALRSLLHTPDHALLLIHDFWIRPRYRPVLRFLDPIERADSLAVFRRKGDLDKAALKRVIRRYERLPGDRPVKDRVRTLLRLGWRRR
ncbi:MAG: hypothetical protein WD056_01465 [Gemmatimonadota bacterium]